MNGKHAYLIIAHDQPELLKALVRCIDHPRNDIYCHLDAKWNVDKDEISTQVNHSNIYFTKRINVHWGGYSQIKCELLLLEQAVNQYHYDFYHLLSGRDLPLRKQEEILSFFDKNQDVEFISMKGSVEDTPYEVRVRYYYCFQDMIKNRKNTFGKCISIIQYALVKIQKIIGVNRIKNTATYGIGANWFDITDKMARYVVANQDLIYEMFHDTICCDEIFLQTMYLNMLDKNPLYQEKHIHSDFVAQGELNIHRFIDWKRGNPYTLTENDYGYLVECGLFYGRKFDILKNENLVRKIEKINTV